MVEEVKEEQRQETGELVATAWDKENFLAQWSDDQIVARREELLLMARSWSKYTDKTDVFRNEEGGASIYGGFELRDAAQTSKLRSAITELLSMVGRKIFNGDFNLTRISFPIKCMSPQSDLMRMTGFASTLPIYMRRAAETDDPVERLKLVMTQNISWFMLGHNWQKPLNPILGETFQAVGQDGTKIYLEQSSHHPPRSHFFAEAHDNAFTMNGYLEYEIYAGLKTSQVIANGFKQVNFKDGGKIKWNQNNDTFSGVFLGTMLHQLDGKVTFVDEANNLEGYYQFGAYTFKKQDYVWGEIKHNGKKVCEVAGNYTGFLDFDEVRYWDIRETSTYFELAGEVPNSLPSQASKRTDGLYLISKTVEEAQEEKERLENLQRNDRKLREEALERRSKGGPKYKTLSESTE